MKNAVDARLKTRQAAISLNTRRAAEPLRLRRPVTAPARPRLARQAQSADLGSTGTPRMAARRPRSAGVNPLARLERLAGSGLVRPRRATGPRAATITGQGSRDAGGAGRLRLEEDGRATVHRPLIVASTGRTCMQAIVPLSCMFLNKHPLPTPCACLAAGNVPSCCRRCCHRPAGSTRPQRCM